MLWIFINVFHSAAAGLNDLCLSLSASPSSNVPGNKLHFSLFAAAAAANLLLRDKLSRMQHILFRILCLYTYSMHGFVCFI